MHTTQNNESGVGPDSPASVYDQIVHSITDHLRQQGFSSVRANSEGFSRPGKIKWEEEDEGVVPDVTAEHNGAVYVFEIETRDHLEPENVEDRWRLLSVHAKRHHGRFYLVTPETKAGYLERFAARIDVQPEFLKLSGID
jgi:hypothetical protein